MFTPSHAGAVPRFGLSRMKRRRTFITRRFLDRVRTNGALATAAARVSSLRSTYAPLPHMTTWALVCEEVVDTEHSPQHYERVAAELFRRGVSRETLEEMRMFAWETAGWLNFEKLLWDWCSLDERDIEMAIDWQFREGEINEDERRERVAYLQKFMTPTGREPRPSGGSGTPLRDQCVSNEGTA
ncbi:MAG: hypothetical protein HYY24_10925 [Verrucomicrobia bacterium]|nr:hypothetical protein [Verrucomicrobiota bacterium]